MPRNRKVSKKIRNKQKTILLTIAILIATLLVLVAVQVIHKIIVINENARNLMAIYEELDYMSQSKNFDTQRIKVLVSDANAEVSSIQSEVKPYYGLFKALRSVPGIGPYSDQVEPVVEFAASTLSVSQRLMDLFFPLLDAPLLDENRSELVQVINENQAIIKQCGVDIERATGYFSQIEPGLYPQNIRVRLEVINQLLPQVTNGLSFLQLIPQATGNKTPVTYLILLQNTDEIRPTGGFITMFGLLRIENGKISYIDFQDFATKNYISQVVEAPAPLKNILEAYYWLPRDGNWSPSFPESAKKVQELFFLSTGIKTDGVIGVNQNTLSLALEALGPVLVNGEAITSDNVRNYMISEKMNAIQQGNQGSRKAFVAPLFSAIIGKFSKNVNKDSITGFLKFLQTAFIRGDIQIFSLQPEIQSLLQKYRISGDLVPGDGDYFMLVDANLGINKADLVVTRKISYSVDLSNALQPFAIIQIEYNNPMQGDITCHQTGDIRSEANTVSYLNPSCYWNYWRILGKTGTEVTSFTLPDFSDNIFESGFNWSHTPTINQLNGGIYEFGGLTVVTTNSTSQVIVKRSIPVSFLHETSKGTQYLLNIQKQVGIRELPIEVRVLLPSGTEINLDDTNINLVNGPDGWIWQGNLANNLTTIQITFTK